MEDLFKQISPKKIKEYQQHLEGLDLSESTIKRRLSSLRKFTGWAEKQGYLEKPPIKKVPIKTPAFIFLPSRLRPPVPPVPYLTKAYERYSSISITKYLHFAILIIFCVGLGMGIYFQLTGPKAELAEAYPSTLTPPKRYLSFQGRLTDSSNNPITSTTNFVFKLYDAAGSGEPPTGGNELWSSGDCSIDPDQDGIFSVLLGSDCGSEITSDVFSENAEVWLQITVGTGGGAETLSPRIQIATVGYALSAETLQGFPPGTAASNIPYIDSSGDITIAAASPSIISSSGTFGIEGQALSITTATGTDGNITIAPDGSGVVNINVGGTGPSSQVRITNANMVSGNLVSIYAGTDAMGFNLLNLSSGSSETSVFSVDESGHTYIAGNLGIGTSNPGQELDIVGDIQLTGNVLMTDDNYIGISGNERIIFDTGGDIEIMGANLGIGTTNPSQLLHVAGAMRLEGALYDYNNQAGTSDQILSSTGSGVDWVDISSIGIGGTGTAGYVPKWLSSSTLGDSVLYEDGTNVGIGTTSPNYTLDVEGKISVSEYMYANILELGTTGGKGTLRPYYDDGLHFSAASGVDQNRNIIIVDWDSRTKDYDHDTQSANPTLFIHSATDPDTDNTEWGSLSFEGTGGGGGYFYLSTGTGDLVLSPSGNVGIGATSPADKLAVSGGTVIGSGYAQLTSAPSNGLLVEGNVGIGTTEPGYPLEITPSSATTLRFMETGSPGAAGFQMLGEGASVNYAWQEMGKLTGNQERWQFGVLNPSLNFFWKYDDGVSGDKQYLTIDTLGNLGIGTTNPGYKLEVVGSLQADDYYSGNDNQGASTTTGGLTFEDGLYISGTATSGVGGTGTAGYVPKWLSSSTLGDSVIYEDGTNVGIGTTGPQDKFHVVSGVNSSAILEGTGKTFIEIWNDNSSDSGIFWGDADGSRGALRFGSVTGYGATGFTERMRITENGEVGIKDTDPDAMLDILSNSAAMPVLRLEHASSPTSDYLQIASNGAIGGDILTIDSGGNLGIGTTAPSQKLHIDGNMRLTGALYDYNNQAGTSDQILSSTGSGVDWVDISSIGIGGTGTAGYLPKWLSSSTLGDSVLFETGSKIGIGTTNPQVQLHLTEDLMIEGNDILDSGGATAITFDGSQNTALGGYLVMQDDEFIGIGPSAERIIFDNAGDISFIGTNVGIGTTNPSYELEVNGTVATSEITTTSGNLTLSPASAVVSIVTNAGDNALRIYEDSDNGSEYFRITRYNYGTTIQDGYGWINIIGAPIHLNQGADASVFLFQQATSGENPVLRIYGYITAATGSRYSELKIDDTNDELLFTMQSDITGYGFRLPDNAGASEWRIRDIDGAIVASIDSDGKSYFAGNLGIGTTNPSQKLHIDGNMRLTGALYDYNNQAGTSDQILSSTGSGVDWVDISTIGVGGSGTTNYLPKWLSSSTLGDSVLYDDGTNVGIGTTNPSYKLDVAGTAGFNDGGVTIDSSSYVNAQRFVDIGSNYYIDPAQTTTSLIVAGNVGIGTTAPAMELDIAGDATLSGTLSLGPQTQGYAGTCDASSEGKIYYDSDSDRLFYCDGNDWHTDRTTATLIVAANNSQNKERADYICDGTSDESEIESAISALPSGGGVIHLLEGTYNIGTSIDIAKSNVSIIGAGKNTILFLVNGAETDVIVLGDGSNSYEGIQISHLKIDGNEDQQSCLSTPFRGILFNKKITRSRVINTWIDNCQGPAIALTADSDGEANSYNLISENSFYDNKADTCAGYRYTLFLRYSHHNTFSNNHLHDNLSTYGELFGYESDGNNISNNVIENGAGGGIYFDLNCTYNNLSNNIIRNNSGIRSGIHFSYGSSYNTVSTNEFSHNSGHGIFTARSDYNIISNNRFNYNSNGNNNTYDEIHLDRGCNYSLVTNNNIRTTDARYGIYEGIPVEISDYNIIKNNVIRGAVTAPIKIIGDNTTVSGNQTDASGEAQNEIKSTATSQKIWRMTHDEGVLTTNAMEFDLAQNQLDSAFFYDGASYTDNTTEANSVGGTPYTLLEDNADYFYFGKSSEFTRITFDLATVGVGLTSSWEYSQGGSSWAALTKGDTTNDLSQDGIVFWDIPSDWATDSVNGATRYWVRVLTSAVSTAPTAYYSTVSLFTGQFLSLKEAGTELFAIDADGNVIVTDDTWIGIGSSDERVVFDEAGDINIMGANLGIGTTNPSQLLHVAGAMRLEGALYDYNNQAGTNGQILSSTGSGVDWVDISSIGIGGTGTAGYLPKWLSSSTLGDSVLYETGSQIGIGTTNPGSLLDVAGEIRGTIFRDRDDTNYYLDIGNTAIAGLFAGNVGIGTTAPSEKLEVSGNLYMSGGDIKTDRWLQSDTNTLIGVNVAGGGNLASGAVGSTFVGNEAGYSNTSGHSNTAFGYKALYTNTSYDQNTAIGAYALQSTDGHLNTAVGYSALSGNTTGFRNTAVGADALLNNAGGRYNVALGAWALYSNTNHYNIALGYEAGYYKSGGTNNIFIGYQAGKGTGDYSSTGNIFLGYQAGFNETGSNKLYIENSNADPNSALIYGDFSSDMLTINGNVGIGTTNPSQKLHIAGNMRLTGALYDYNNQAGTSDQILSSTGSGVDWVDISSIGIGGTGTTGYVPKWLSSSTLGDSVLYDDGANVGIGMASPNEKLEVNGNIRLSPTGDSSLFFDNGAESLSWDDDPGEFDLSDDLDVAGYMAVGGNSTVNDHAMIYMSENYTDTSADFYGIRLHNYQTQAMTHSVYGGYFNPRFTGSGTLSDLTGVLSTAYNTNDGGTVTTMKGFSSTIHNSGTGTIGTATGLRIYNSNDSTGTITTNYGISITLANPSGTVDENYAIRIWDQNSATDNWGIWGNEGDWVLDADGDGSSGGNSGGGDLILGEGQDLRFYHDGYDSYIVNYTGDLYITDTGSDDVLLSTNGGNVGIGTTDPSQKLHIAGNMRLTGALYDVNNQAGTTDQILSSTGSGVDWVDISTIGVGGSGTTGYLPKWLSSSTLGDSVLYETGSQIGIGTTNPGSLLDVAGEIRGTIFRDRDDTNYYLDISNTANAGLFAGNVGIGTTGPGAKLEIANANSSPGDGLRLTHSDTAWYWDFYLDNTGARLIIDPTSASKMKIDADLGVGDFPVNRLDVEGAVAVGSSYSGTVTAPSNGMIIEGNVGIGTTTPKNILDVSGSVAFGSLPTSSLPQSNMLYVSGNVGIGRTDPGYKLEVQGEVAFRDTGGSNDFITFYSNTYRAKLMGRYTSDDNPVLHIYNSNATNTTRPSFRVETTNVLTGGNLIEAIHDGNMRFVVGVNGNVGIGTTAPSQELHIEGAMRLTGALYDYNNQAGTSDQILSSTGSGVDWVDISSIGVGGTGTTGYVPKWLSSSTLGDSVLFETGSKIGIGTTNPQVQLHLTEDLMIEGNDILDSGGATAITFDGSQNTALGGYLIMQDDEFVGISPSAERIIFDNAGDIEIMGANVGIGTTAPGYRLAIAQVAGHGAQIALDDGYNYSARLGSYYGNLKLYTKSTGAVIADTRLSVSDNEPDGIFEVSGSGGSDDLVLISSNDDTDGDFLIIKNSGNVGIGATSPADTLAVSGGAIIGSGYAQLTSAPSDGLLVEGNVGIGTTGPGAKLEVIDTLKVTDADGTSYLSIDSSTNGKAYIYSEGNDSFEIGPGASWLIFNPGGGGSLELDKDNIPFVLGNDQDYSMVYNSTTDNLEFLDGKSVGTNVRMVIDSGGNVGIGTTAPSQKLHIAGNMRLTGALYDVNNQAGTSDQILSSTGTGVDWVDISSIGIGGTGTTGYVPKWLSSSTLGDSVIYDDGTNVGIGTTGPSKTLEVSGKAFIVGASGDGDATLVVKNLSVYQSPFTQYIQEWQDNTGTVQGWMRADGVMFVDELRPGHTGNNQIGGSSNLSINTWLSGGVDISTMNNNADITLNTHGTGDIIATTDPDSYLVGSTLAGGDLFIAGTKNATAGDIFLNPDGGNVGIGTTAPSQELHIEGDMRLTGALYDVNNQAGTSDQILSSTGSGVDWVDISSIGIGGTGTTGYVPKWLSSSTLGDSVIFDDGANIGIGMASPNEKLEVNGNIRLSPTGDSFLYFDNGVESLSWDDSPGEFDLSDDLDVAGHVAFGADGAVATDRIIDIDETFTDGTATNYGLVLEPTFNLTATGNRTEYGLYLDARGANINEDGNQVDLIGLYSQAWLSSSSTADDVVGIQSYGFVQHSTDTIGTVHGINSVALNDSTGSVSYARGIYAYVRNDDGYIGNARGGHFMVFNNVAGGTIASARGVESRVYEVAGTITTGYGGYFECDDAGTCYALYASANDAQPTTNYGLWVESSGATTDNYGIYGVEGDWVLDADGNGLSGGTGPGGDIIIGEGQDLRFYHDGYDSHIVNYTGDLYITDTGSDDVLLSTNGGNVGIGTTAPGRELEVVGAIEADDYYSGNSNQGGSTTTGGLTFEDGLYISGAATSGVGGTGTAGYVPKWLSSSTLGDSVLFDDGTNVGIGTTNPNDKIDVVGEIDTSTYYKLNNLRILDVENSNTLRIGQYAGESLTAGGDNNTLVGQYAGYSLTDGDDNTLIGTEAGRYNQTGSQNVFMGYFAGRGTGTYTGANANVIIGYYAGYNISSNAVNNIMLGSDAGSSLTSGDYNIYIGSEAGRYNQTGQQNVFMGLGAGRGTGTYTGSDFNVIIGHNAGYNISSSQDRNVFIGYQSGYNETGSNKLYIENSSAGPNSALIYGDFSTDTLTFNGNVGIGTTAPGRELEVVGAIEADDYYSGNSNQGGSTTTGGLTFEDGLYISGAATSGVGGTGTAGYVPKWTSSSTLGNSLIFEDGTNVGIGITAPDGLFDIRSTASNEKLRLSYDSNIYATFSLSGTGGLTILTNSTGSNEDIELRTPSFDNALYIDESAQDIGIGTASPEEKLTVDGNLQLGMSDATRYVYFHDGGSPYAGIRYESGTNKMQFSHDGSSWNDMGSGAGYWTLSSSDLYPNLPSYNVGIGTTDSAGTAKLYVNGNVGIGITAPNEQLEITGNFRLPTTTASTGIIKAGANRFIHNFGTNNAFLGVDAGNLTLSGANDNVGIGYQALDALTSGDYNVGIGSGALGAFTSGNGNVAIGYNALSSNTDAWDNIAIGREALANDDPYGNNIAIGYQALYSGGSGAQYNVAIGNQAMEEATWATENIAIGANALFTNDGTNNVAVGSWALDSATSTDFTTAVGDNALGALTSGDNNTAVGAYTASSTTIGHDNVYLGYNAGRDNQTGNYNIFIGVETAEGGSTFTGSDYNVLLGYRAGYNFLSSADRNIFIGPWAGYGFSATSPGLDNIFIGSQAGYSNDGGDDNIFLGTDAGYTNTTGSENTIIGYQAGYLNSTGTYNTFMGMEAGYNTTTDYNTFIGADAGYRNSSGGNNTALGFEAGFNQQTGNNNIFLGYQAGKGSSTYSASGNIFLGYQAGYSETGSNKLYIENSNAGPNSALIYGDFSTDTLTFNGNVGIGTTAPDYPLHVETSSALRAGYFKNTQSTYTSYGVYSETDSTDAPTTALYGIANLDTTSNNLARGVYGKADASDSAGSAADAYGGQFVAYADDVAYGVLVDSYTDTDTAYGVYAYVQGNAGSTTTYALYGEVTDGATDWGIYMTGEDKNYLSGNLGIGTTDPNDLLHVLSSGDLDVEFETTATGANYVGLMLTSPEGSWGLYTPSTGHSALAGDFGIYDWGATTYRFVIMENGNVGIGTGNTTAPSSLLELASTAPTFRMTDSTGSAKSLLLTVDGDLAQFEEAGGAANDLFVLDLANGNVGIGTTNPQAKLDIAGATSTISNSAGDITIDAASNNISFAGDNLTNILNLYVSGNLGVGTTAPATQVHLTGDLTVAGNDIYDSGGSPAITFDGSQNIALGGNLTAYHIYPQSDDTYDLGSNTLRWRDLYLGPATIHLGTSTSDEGTITYNTTNNSLSFASTSGNLGIGTTAPGFDFQVGAGTVGSVWSGHKIVAADSSDARIGAYVNNLGVSLRSAGTFGEIFAYDYPTGAADLVLNQFGGNVGIGTTAPSEKLEINGNLIFTVGADRTLTVAKPPSTGPGYDLSIQAGDGTYAVVPAIAGDLYLDGGHGGGSTADGDVLIATRYGGAYNLVGIGTTDPSYKLDVAGDVRTSGDIFLDGGEIFGTVGSDIYLKSGDDIFIDIDYDDGNSGQLIFRAVGVNIGSMSESGSLSINGNFTANLGTATSYFVCSDTSGTGSQTLRDCSGSDYAEYFAAEAGLEPGDLLSAAPNTSPESSRPYKLAATSEKYDSKLIGAVSTDGLVANEQLEPTDILVALVGQIPLKVSTFNGPIEVGDPITSSDLPGIGMKLTKAGPIIGKALESFDGAQGEPCSQKPEHKCSKILVFVNLGWYDPDVYLTDAGDLHIKKEGEKYVLKDTEGNIIERVGVFAQTAIAQLQSGLINAQEIITQKLTSQEIQTQEIDTQRIILSEIDAKTGEDVVISLTEDESQSKFGKLIIKGTDGAEVATIDAEGNATFSGELSAPKSKFGELLTEEVTTDTLEVSQDATIAGTLYADKIVSEEIVGLQGKFGELLAATVSAQQIQGLEERLAQLETEPSPTPIPTPTPTPSPESEPEVDPMEDIGLDPEIEALVNEILNSSTEATDQAELANFSGEDLAIADSLTVLGITSLADTTIAGTLNVDGTMTLSDNSINSLTGTLYLQSLGLGGIDMLAGKVRIDEEGNAVFEGDLTVKGRLALNQIEPLPEGEGEIVIDLNPEPEEEGTESKFGQLLVKGMEDEIVASIDASGSAFFASLDIEADYSATESGAIIAAADNYLENGYYNLALETNATAGIGILPAGKTEIQIYNPRITDQSLIYLVPTSDTENKVLYVESKLAHQEAIFNDYGYELEPEQKGWFKVAIDTPLYQEIEFNWWIVGGKPNE